MENCTVGKETGKAGEAVLCRLCMKNREYFLSIFHSDEVCRISIGQLILNVLHIELTEGDGLPGTVCPQCVTKLMEFNEFRVMCINSESELKRHAVQNEIVACSVKNEAVEFLDEGGSSDVNDLVDDGFQVSEVPSDAGDPLVPGSQEVTASQLQDKVRALEAKLEEVRASTKASETVAMSLEDLRAMFVEINTLKEKDMERRVKKVVAMTFEEKMQKLAESLSGNVFCEPASNSLDGNYVATDLAERVHIGSGIYCSQAAYKTMMIAEEDSKWASALLVGVFGEEDAKKMRVYPRKEGLKSFSSNFLSVAKGMYRDRLLRIGRFEGNISELKKAVNKLPSYLADRSLDLLGTPRNSARTSLKRSGTTDGTRLRHGKKGCRSSGVVSNTSDSDVQSFNPDISVEGSGEQYAIDKALPQPSETEFWE